MPTQKSSSRDSLTRLLEEPGADELEEEKQNDLDVQEAYVLEQLQHLHDELASKRAEQRTVRLTLPGSSVDGKRVGGKGAVRICGDGVVRSDHRAAQQVDRRGLQQARAPGEAARRRLLRVL
jgi:hypothetical protein